MTREPRLEHWRPNRFNGGWFRMSPESRRSIAIVYFGDQGWYAAVDKPEGGSWKCWFVTDDLARAGADSKLLEYGWVLS